MLGVSSGRISLDGLLRSLRAQAQTNVIKLLEILVVGNGVADAISAIVDKCRNLFPQLSIRYLECEQAGIAAGWNAGLAVASTEWVMFCAQDVRLPPNFSKSADAFFQTHADPELVMLYSGGVSNHGTSGQTSYGSRALIPDKLERVPGLEAACLFRRKLLVMSGLQFDSQVRPGFEFTVFTANYLLTNSDKRIAVIHPVKDSNLTQFGTSEPRTETWKEKATYRAAITHGYLQPLKTAIKVLGSVPRWLQRTVLLDLQWYFTVDMRERSPTVAVNECMAVEFHEIVREVMSLVEVETITSLDAHTVNLEVRHALLSYKHLECHSPVALDAYDHEQGLVRLNYYIHGTPPTEVFMLDGERVEPAYCKYRGCRFFRRMLLRQRIVWLHASRAKAIQVLLNDQEVELTVGNPALLPLQKTGKTAGIQMLNTVKTAYPAGKGKRKPLPTGLSGVKVRFVRWLARQALVRKKFDKAWLFLDRETEADENAEHLYRWVRKNHPEINAWFLLDRSSTDWNRLAAEGFRLIPQGWLRKLLILNSEHIISSQAEYMSGGYDRLLYGDLMNWRYTFLQHGVIINDLSHWLSNQDFDLFVTSGPAEHASIVDNDTPYTYTAREMRRTGLPRHDRLLKLARQEPPENVNLVLIMPTWRGSLSKERSEAEIENSQYVQHWGTLMRSSKLKRLITQSGKRLAFMPHPNAVPYLKAFNIPDHVQVFTKADIGIQRLFARSAAMVTDYSSVAFEMAYLRRLVIYFQFDREQFFGGEHNWREGYFDYGRDGFGPVATREAELLDQLKCFLLKDLEPGPKYLARMARAIPEQDGKACERVYQNIIKLNQPFKHDGIITNRSAI